MHAHKSRQHGFSVIELLVILVIVALVAIVGVLFWQRVHGHSQQKNGNAQVQGSKHTGWVTYKSPSGTFSFEYPADWKLVKPPNTNTVGWVLDSVYVTGPNNFKLTFEVQKEHVNTALSCAVVTLGPGQQVDDRFSGRSELDGYGGVNEVAVVGHVSNPSGGKSCGGLNVGYNAITKDTGFVSFGSYYDGEKVISKPADTYFDQPEIKTTLAIWKTISY